MTKLNVIFLLGILAVGCTAEEKTEAERQAYIQQEAQNKIAQFRRDVMQQCYNKALEKASILADSILLVEARMELDTAGRPPKPVKPEKPTLKTLLDSTDVKPLFNQ